MGVKKAKTGQGDWESRFLHILNNRPSGTDKPREHGFIVVVRSAQSLLALQDLCFSPKQQWNRGGCLTASYRQGPGPRFGTLFGAFISDCFTLGSDGPELYGDLRPRRDDNRWLQKAPFIADDYYLNHHSIPSSGTKEFSHASLETLLNILADDSLLKTGERLVLFSEGVEASKDADEWHQALDFLLPRLPERCGLVLSGLPENFDPSTLASHPNFLELMIPEAEPAPADEDADSTLTYLPGALEDDYPAAIDQLGVERYAGALAEFILHPDTRPLTIGIHGEWGKGKSSFIGFVERELIMQAESNQAELRGKLSELDRKLLQLEAEVDSENIDEGKLASRKLEAARLSRQRQTTWQEMRDNAAGEVICVPFNAWRYQDAKQLWAGLASVTTRQLEKRLSWLQRFVLPLKYAWIRNRRALIWTDLLPLGFAILFTIFIWSLAGPDAVGVEMAENKAANQSQDGSGGANESDSLNKAVDVIGKELKIEGTLGILSGLLPLTSTFLVAGLLGWRSYLLVKPVSQRIRQYSQMPDYRDQLGYQNQVLRDIAFVYRQFSAGDNRPRVVIFIDDLDRCSDDKVMEILQAIHLILGANEFYVFLAIDTAMIYRAIENHYGDQKAAHGLPRGFARKYLRKIIQLSFHLPNATEEEQARLIGSLFSKQANDTLRAREIEKGRGGKKQVSEKAGGSGSFASDFGELNKARESASKFIEDSAEELEAFLQHYDYIADNAREVKRLINVHRLVKILLQRTGVIWSPTQQQKLIKWMVFCTRWPELIQLMFRVADQNPNSDNCFLELCNHLNNGDQRRAELQNFASDEKIRLSSSDLTEHKHLNLTAEFTQMFQRNLELHHEDDTASDTNLGQGEQLKAN